MKPVNTRIWTWNRLRVFETRCGGRCALVLAHRCHRLSVSVLTDEVMWGVFTLICYHHKTQKYTHHALGTTGEKIGALALWFVAGGPVHGPQHIRGTLFSLREPPQAIAARVGVRYPHLSRDVCAGPRGSRRLGCVPVRDIAVPKTGW